MEIRFCIGAFQVGQEHMLQRLSENTDLLLKNNIILPDAQQTAHFVATLRKDKGPDAWQKAKNFVGADENTSKILIISPSVSGVAHRPIVGSSLYPNAGKRLESIVGGINNDVDVKVYYTTRNPATFVPASYANALRNGHIIDRTEFLGAVDLANLRWSNLLHQIQLEQDNIQIATWSWEDYAESWQDMAHAFSGVPHDQTFDEGEPRRPEMSFHGAQKMYEFLSEEEEHTQALRDKIFDVIARKFPATDDPDKSSFWTSEVIEQLTYAYEDDLYYIDRMDNLEVIRRKTMRD